MSNRNCSEYPGLIIANHGQSLEVEDLNGAPIICSKRQNLDVIVPGDRVVWQPVSGSADGVIVKIEPRTTLLSRPDTRGKLHAVAANVDQMFIIIAPAPAPSQTTIDRYLVAAELQQIRPVLVLNKKDLLNTEANKTKLLEELEYYKKIGVTSLSLSALKKDTLTPLNELLANKTSVFVGQSGVGKSSLISDFLPGQDIKIGDISSQIKQGRHTTTTARLYHLEHTKGVIIDSPGIREFPLWPMEATELAQGFSEFKPYLHQCKFRNCTHLQKEPGCALLQAINSGRISSSRLVSYQKILESMRG